MTLSPVEGLYCKRPIQCLASSKILTPHPLASLLYPPPAVGAGGGHTRWVERGWGVNSSEDARHCTLYMKVYFVVSPVGPPRLWEWGGGTSRGWRTRRGRTQKAQEEDDGKHSQGRLCIQHKMVESRRLQKDVVYLGWPIAPSYMSPNAGGGG